MSKARVLLNGLGSDELLGGYGRHRSAFNTGGWAAAIEEVSVLVLLLFPLSTNVFEAPTRP